MAGIASPIQELRTSLEKSRWQLHDGLRRLEDHLQHHDAEAPPATGGVASPVLFPASIPGLPHGQAARIMGVALMAGLAVGLSWSRRKR